MENECMDWLNECMKAFPNLKKYTIACGYAKTPEHIMGRLHSSVAINREVNAEEVLLGGKSAVIVREETSKDFRIEINTKLRNIRNPLLRKQVVMHTIIYELVRIDNMNMVIVRKEGERTRRMRLNKKEFEEEFLRKFNEVRALSGLPPVANMANVNAAIAKILSEIKYESE